MKRWVACGVVFLAACAGGSETESTSPEIPAGAPRGLVQGFVLDGTTTRPIDKALVALRVGGSRLEATSDQSGWFVLADVPAGSSLSIDFEATGYAKARGWVSVDDEVGDHPQSNSIAELEARLYPNPNQLKVTVLDGFNSKPLAGMTIVAQHAPTQPTGPLAILDSPTATTAGDGSAVLAGIATWQTYDVTCIGTLGYESASATVTQGKTAALVLKAAPIGQVPTASCTGSPDFCCASADPCGLGNNGACDCAGCGWDTYDCN